MPFPAVSLPFYGVTPSRLNVQAWGRYPINEEGLEALVKDPPDVEHWNGPCLKRNSIPEDPRGNPYRYRYPGEHGAYDLYSLGADNAPDGAGGLQGKRTASRGPQKRLPDHPDVSVNRGLCG